MSTGQITNQSALRALLMRGGTMALREGLVSSYDPVHGAVKVKLQPNDQETGWLPIETPWAGNGFGMGVGPSQDDQAIIAFAEGDLESGVCLGFIGSDVDRPMGVPSGEAWLVHKAGAFIKFTNDPKLTFGDGAGAVITMAGGNITSHGVWAHTGGFTTDTFTSTNTTSLGGGGKKVALDGDPVVGGVVQASSTKTKAT